MIAALKNVLILERLYPYIDNDKVTQRTATIIRKKNIVKIKNMLLYVFRC